MYELQNDQEAESVELNADLWRRISRGGFGCAHLDTASLASKMELHRGGRNVIWGWTECNVGELPNVFPAM